MRTHQGNRTPQSTIEQSSGPKLRDAAQRPTNKPKLDAIHPSLRALPDYPE